MKIKQIDECTFSPIKKGNILNCVNYKFSVMRLDTERYISMIFLFSNFSHVFCHTRKQVC